MQIVSKQLYICNSAISVFTRTIPTRKKCTLNTQMMHLINQKTKCGMLDTLCTLLSRPGLAIGSTGRIPGGLVADLGAALYFLFIFLLLLLFIILYFCFLNVPKW